MKFRLLLLLALIIPALPHFMPTRESYIFSICIGFLWFIACFILFLVFLISLINLNVKSITGNSRLWGSENFKKKFKRIREISLLLLLSFFTYFQMDNIIEFWQVRKIERIMESNNLYEKKPNQVSEKLKNHNRDSRWFLINYSAIFPKNNESLAHIEYHKDLLFEDWDCHLYYSKEKPDGPPYEIIGEGENGYNWYKWCNY